MSEQSGKWAGVLSDFPETVREMLLQGGSLSIDLRVKKVARLGHLPKPFVEITMPCGEYRLFKLAEIPKKSAHCTCGAPQHWFIKYERREAFAQYNISPN